MTTKLLHTGGRILAAIDGSPHAAHVTDAAAWVARRVDAPLEFVHVLDRHAERAPAINLSGSLDLGAQDDLLDELSELDARRSKLAQERGRLLLLEARRRAAQAGVPEAEARMRHGALAEALTELEEDVRLFVLGKRGEHADAARGHLGSRLERVVRSVHRPLLVTSGPFTPPERLAIAFDGSDTTRRCVQIVAASPLYQGVHCHVVTVGTESAAARSQLEWARGYLDLARLQVTMAVVPGSPDTAIAEYVRTHGIGLLVMGAYGHSRVRQLLVGSTTTALLRTVAVPVLLLR